MKLDAVLCVLLPLIIFLFILGNLARSYAKVRLMTLRQAWSWSVVAAFFALLAILLSFEPLGVSTKWIERAWFLTFVLATIPGISVLGARKPGNVAWNWFILLPLCLVLFLPAVDRTGITKQIDLEWPRYFGHCFVLLMGVGNYFGTRDTLKSMLFFSSVVGLGLTFTPAVDAIPSIEPQSLRALSVLFLLPLAFPKRLSTVRRTRGFSPENIWREFRDAYGIVWAKRVMDRVNRSAEEENWPDRLGLDGIVSCKKNRNSKEIEHSNQRFRDILRWQLKRFYDDDWIAAYFPTDEETNFPQESPDRPL